MSALQKGRMASQQFPTKNGKTVSVVAISSNGTPLPTPLMSYYFHMPRDSPCVISVNNTKRAPRFFHEPLSIPKRDIECWDQARIEQEARTIRALYPAVAENVVIPGSWEDLYRYFDAHDLWLQGAWNLWAVVDELGYQNQKLQFYRREMEAIRAMGPRFPLQPYEIAMISDFVEGWVSFTENRFTLIEWDGLQDILQLLSPVDWTDGGIEGLNETQADFLREELTYWHGHWRERYENPALFFPPDQWHHLGGKYAGKGSFSGPRKRFVTPYDKPFVAPLDSFHPPAFNPSASSGPTAPYPILQAIQHTDFLPDSGVQAGAFSHPLPFSQPVPSFQSKPIAHSVPVSHSVPTDRPVVVNGSARKPHADIVKSGATTEEATNSHQPTMSGSAPSFAPEKDLNKTDTEASGPSHLPKRGPSRLPKRSSEENMVGQEQQPVPNGPEVNILKQEQQSAPIYLEMPERSCPDRHNPRKNSRKSVQVRAITCPNPNHSNCYNHDKAPCKGYNMTPGHFVACPCDRCSNLSRTALVKQIRGPEGMPQSEKAARLRDYFSRFGVIQQCEIKTTANTNRCYALIRFSLENSAVAAVASADGIDLSPISSCIRTEHPWYSKYWTPRPYNKTPPKNSRVSPPSNRQSPPGRGSMNNAAAQQQHVPASSFGSPRSRINVGQGHKSPECFRGPPPGFPPAVFNTQAVWQPSPPRMPPQPPVPMNGHRPDYHGPSHYPAPVPFHQQTPHIPEHSHQCAIPPPRPFNQGFQPQGPPQWHHGPPYWHHGPMPPPPPPPFHGTPHLTGPQPQPPFHGAPPFYNQRNHYEDVRRPVNPEVQTRQPLAQHAPSQSLAQSSSSSGDGSIRINLPGISPEQPNVAQTTERDSHKKTSSADSGSSPDEPAAPTEDVSPSQGQQHGGVSEKAAQTVNNVNESEVPVRSARFSIQDVRFDQNLSGTVRIRPNRRSQHRPLPAEWLFGSSQNVTPVEQATQPGPKNGGGSRNVSPVEQGGQSGHKKCKKNNKKAGARTNSRPSTPMDSCSKQSDDSKDKAPAEKSEPVKETAALQVPGPKGYRADAGGSLKMSRNRKGPAIRVSNLVAQDQPPLGNESPEEKPSDVPVFSGDSAEQSKQARFKRFDSLSSIPDCPVLPRACDLFPNYPDLSTSPPRIVMTPAETTPAEEETPCPQTSSLTHGSNGMHRVSDSSVTGHSYCQSFYSAKSTLSSRENSPPENKDGLFVSPPESPTKHSTASQPSSATLSAHPSPKTAAAVPASGPPKENAIQRDTKPEASEPLVSKSETSQPEDPKSEANKQNPKRKNKKNKVKPKSTTAGPSSSSQHHQEQQSPTPRSTSESKPNSRSATPVENNNNNSVRNSKKRKAQAKNAAEKKRSAATLGAGAASSSTDAW